MDPFFVLSDLARQRKDRDILQAILTHINHVRHSCRPDFLRRKGRSKRLVEVEQPLRDIPLWEWLRKGLPEEWCHYFRPENRKFGPVLVFIHPWLFELKIEKHWITHCRQIQPEVMERVAEIEGYFEARKMWPVYWRLKGKSAGRRWLAARSTREKSLDREAQRLIRDGRRGNLCSEGKPWSTAPPQLPAGGILCHSTAGRFIGSANFDAATHPKWANN